MLFRAFSQPGYFGAIVQVTRFIKLLPENSLSRNRFLSCLANGREKLVPYYTQVPRI